MINKTHRLHVMGNEVTVLYAEKEEYISLTDIARYKNTESPADVVKNWMRSKNTIGFLGLWERINNADFKLVEFDQLWEKSGVNAFVLSPQKWITTTNATGIVSKSGKGGGTFAHKDIAFEFGSWLSSEFKLYLIKEFQRLKEKEEQTNGWNVSRLFSKINHHVHTESIKTNLILEKGVSKDDEWIIYAEEVDLLNVAVWGMTAQEWKKYNSTSSCIGNLRDHASLAELTVLSNMESLNAHLLRGNKSKKERYYILANEASKQLAVFRTLKKSSMLEKTGNDF